MLQALTPVPVVAATPVSISVPTLVIEALIFIVMVWLMETMVFRPVRKAWHRREEAIQAGLRAVGTTRDEADEAREAVRRILGEARRQAQALIDEAAAAGEAVRSRVLEDAAVEFQRLVEQARLEIQAEQASAAAQLKPLVVDLALQASARVTGQAYDGTEVRKLAASVVEREA